MSDNLVLLAVGDVAARRPEPASMFRHVRSTLRSGDFVFGQLEANISDRGQAVPHARLAMRTSPSVAAAMRDAGFNVISFASNHCLDWGPQALFDTVDHLKAVDIPVCGVGADISEARAPVCLASGGAKLAVLAYSSILPLGYWATADRAGCAPMRAHTIYEQIKHDQPGTPARIHTFAHREDLADLIADVQRAKQQGYVVAISIHWGIHFIPEQIADYQREVAYAAIDAGADIILGHHPHILKGVEVYKGKVIFYSLGNFALEPPTAFQDNLTQTASFKEIAALNPNWDLKKKYIMPSDMRRTLIVKCAIDGTGLGEVSLLPVYINDDSEPEIQVSGTPLYDEVCGYIEDLSRRQDFDTVFMHEKDRVVVSSGAAAAQASTSTRSGTR